MERTFHHDRSPLHGITVVVETTGDEVWVGRCDDEDGDRVVLVDADVHRDGEGGVSRREWLQKAALFGVWPNHPRVVLPRRAVAFLSRLGEGEPPGAGEPPR